MKFKLCNTYYLFNLKTYWWVKQISMNYDLSRNNQSTELFPNFEKALQEEKQIKNIETVVTLYYMIHQYLD